MKGEHERDETAMVREAACALPKDLRILRLKAMLEPLADSLGVEEVECPACEGSGWLDIGAVEHCPLCCGFQELPRSAADWFRCRLARLREGQCGEPPDGGGPANPAEERLGRMADHPRRLHLINFD